MKRNHGWWILILGWLAWHPTGLTAIDEAPGRLRVINLGEQTIDSFTVVGFDFHDVGLASEPGDVLTPTFSSNATTYELYWRLADGSVHGEVIDVAAQPPYDYVVISIHDDHLELTTARIHPEWDAYQRVGDPSAFSKPTVPYYTGCDGPLLTHSIAEAAWSARANTRANRDAMRTREEFGCALDWYIPRSDASRTHGVLSDDGRRIEWRKEMENFRKTVR